jgi:hypothetical protein
MSSLLTGDFDETFINFVGDYFSKFSDSEHWLKINEGPDEIELYFNEGSWYIDYTSYTVFTEFLEALKELKGSYSVMYVDGFNYELLYGEFEHIC